MRTSVGRFFRLACLAAGFLLPSGAGAVVISEIHYHPPRGEEELEWLELANDSSTPEDLSGYAFVEGISFEFPPGTVLPGRGFLVIAADAALLRARLGLQSAIGDFTGRLDNAGERLTLVNHAGVPVQSLRFRDAGKWPVGPDGTGHTLSLREVHLDPSEPESWTQSLERGGTPGKANFPGGEETVEERVVIERGATWLYRKGVAAFSTPPGAWLDPAFNDSSWEAGPSGFGYADGDDATLLDDMMGGYSGIACRKRFTLGRGDLEGAGDFFLAVDFDDGFCAYLNGEEVARVNCGAPGQVPQSGQLATASREAGNEVLFQIRPGLLREGENVLAVAGFNQGLTSSDFSLIPRLLHRRLSSPGEEAFERALVAPGAAWRIRKGTGPFSVPPRAWSEAGFDDSGWASGPSGFGYRVAVPGAVAFVVPAGTAGNQDFGGALGMDFDVLEDIEVVRLGVFDSGSDGLQVPLAARLFDRRSTAALASLDFPSGAPGNLVDGSRFLDLRAPLTLPAGFEGTIVAEGYGALEPNGNQGVGPLALSVDDGGGAIRFVGAGRFGSAPGAFPDSVDGGPANRYAAGTFVFRRPGAPGSGVEAPPSARTLLEDMKGGYTTLACRAYFTLTAGDLAGPGDFLLGVDFDAGFVAYLNGAEVARSSAGPAGAAPAWNDLASASRGAGGEALFTLPRGLLVEGVNVLALLGLNESLQSADFLLSPRLFLRGVRADPRRETIVFNELFRGARPGEGWIEVHNPHPRPADLSGFFLTEDPDLPDPLMFAAGTVVPPGGFLILDEASMGTSLQAAKVQLFLLDPEGQVLEATTFDRAPPPGVAPGGWSEVRHPDGGPLEWVSLTPTAGAPNRVEAWDQVVINEIFYHPPEGREDEFIELHNHGTEVVDLSGFRFDQGITFTFPAGAVLEPGGYLALSREPERIRESHGVAALGPYEGVLSDRGESVRLVDRLGNPVDRVRYHDGGDWPSWADGGGSSLELVDPAQHNSLGSAWEASDETGKAVWEELSFDVPRYVQAPGSELHLYLVERGAVRIDDVSVRRGAGANLIPNPGFESSTAPWLLGGTHVGSRRITTDRRSGSACLEVVATGKGDTLVNRIETDTSPALTAGPYQVSLWARWQRGSSLLIVHGEYSAGPYRTAPCFTCGVPAPNLSGNPLSAALRLTVPSALGTPGRENGARRRLIASSGSGNLGPVMGEVGQRPASPLPGVPAIVTARVSDSDGVRSVRAFYRTGNAAGPFGSIDLEDLGEDGDGAAGDGVYGGQIPGFPASTRVVFYLEATDEAGATRRYPPEATEDTLIYLVQPSANDPLDRVHVVLDDRRAAELQTRELHSNDLLEGSFLFNDREIYHQVAVRYRGSPWGRPARQSLRVRFPEDRRFHRGWRDLNISKTGGAASEGAALFLSGRNARPGKPSPTVNYHWVRASLNSVSLGLKGLVETVDSDFVERWYGEGSRGPLLKAFGRFVFTDSGGLTGQQGWEGASLAYRGEDPENYRGYYVHGMEQSEDRWDPLIALTRLLDPAKTPDPVLDQEVGKLVDLEGFLRVHGARVLVGDYDAFLVNNGHNGYLVFDSLKGRWGCLPFDLEATFAIGSPDLFGSADPAVARLLSRPEPRRIYLRTLHEFASSYWSSTAPRPFLDLLQRATGLSTGAILSFAGSSASRVRTTVAPYLAARFRLLTPSPSTTTVPSLEVTGEAPVTVEQVAVGTNGGEPVPLALGWTSPTRWKAAVSLAEARNDLVFFALDGDGILLGTATLAVHYQPSGFLRGDVNGDLSLDLSDALRTLFYLFGGSAPACLDAADFDDDGSVGLGDAVLSLEFLFRGGRPPAVPYPASGSDPTADPLGDCSP